MFSQIASAIIATYITYHSKEILDYVRDKYTRFKRFKRLVKTDTVTALDMYRTGVKLLPYLFYLRSVRYLSNSNENTKSIGDNTYEVRYSIGNRKYKMVRIPSTEPCPIALVTDELGNDKTDAVLAYYGPNYDWHGVPLYPIFFKCKELTFAMTGGRVYKFKDTDDIVLPSANCV